MVGGVTCGHTAVLISFSLLVLASDHSHESCTLCSRAQHGGRPWLTMIPTILSFLDQKMIFLFFLSLFSELSSQTHHSSTGRDSHEVLPWEETTPQRELTHRVRNREYVNWERHQIGRRDEASHYEDQVANKGERSVT